MSVHTLRERRLTRFQLIALVVLTAMFGVSFAVSFLPDARWFFDYQLDKIMHGIASGALATLFFPYTKNPWRVILGVSVVGAGFELLEAQFTPIAGYGGRMWYAIDTLLDIVVDTLGAVIAAKLLFSRFHPG
ncbi:MAG: hypothetical protein HY471_00990 [Candidatus Sungbacteria bacterium]|nr:hypothetical protein [Candidatus Sungbacteria bacterium]